MPTGNLKNATGFPGKTFAKALGEAIATMAGITLDWAEQPANSEIRFKNDAITGGMVLSGKHKAVLLITADTASAREIVSWMTGFESLELADTDLGDGIVELVNMTAGSARAELNESENAFQLTSPFAITGTDLKLITKRNTAVYSARFNADNVQLFLKVFDI
jgi:chemotaxis protein CheX